MTAAKKPHRPFRDNPALARAAGAKGGRVGAASRRKTPPPPYAGNIDDLMDLLGLVGADWHAWRSILKACFVLPLTPAELATFQRLTALDAPPTRLVLELWWCIGRRAGKSTIAALLAFFKGIRANPSLFARGDELIVLPVIAADRKQARVLLSHLRSFARALPQYVRRLDLRDSIELANGITIEIQTSSSRSTRGYTAVAIVADEISFWPEEGSADPASEILAAIVPTMGTVPDPLLVALSNPYQPLGPLFDAVTKYYGQPNNEGVLVVVADTLSMHPSFSRAVIQRAMARDAVKAASEYGDPDTGKILFRQGESALFDQAPVDQAIVLGRSSLAPRDELTYCAWLDAAQGARSGDSMTLCVGHADDGVAIIDKLVERRPPFSPMDVLVNDFAPVLRQYRVRRVVADNVSRGFVEATLASLGITFELSPLDKSALYLNLLNVINSGAVQLLDDATLRLQLLALQRYPATGGRDRVDHPRGRAYHDDTANVVAGVVALLSNIVGAPKGGSVMLVTGAARRVTEPETLAQFKARQAAFLTTAAQRTVAAFDRQDRRAQRDIDRDRDQVGAPDFFIRIPNTR